MSDPFTCSFCFSTFDHTSNPPRMLPCGHSFCTACIDKRVQESQETLICPAEKCNIPAPLTGKDHVFPINYALQQIMLLKNQKVLCPVHEKKMKIVCLVDRCKVCTYCVKFGDHKGHATELMTKVIDEASHRAKGLQEGLHKLQEACRQMEGFHSEEKNVFLGEVQGWFKELKAIVDRKEQEALGQVSRIFDAEGPRMRELAGFSGEYEKIVEEKIGSLKDIVNDQSGVDLLADNDMEKRFEAAKDKLMGYKSEFTGKLKSSAGLWKENLVWITKKIEIIELSLRNTGETVWKADLKSGHKDVKEGKENLRGDGNGILRELREASLNVNA